MDKKPDVLPDLKEVEKESRVYSIIMTNGPSILIDGKTYKALKKYMWYGGDTEHDEFFPLEDSEGKFFVINLNHMIFLNRIA